MSLLCELQDGGVLTQGAQVLCMVEMSAADLLQMDAQGLVACRVIQRAGDSKQ